MQRFVQIANAIVQVFCIGINVLAAANSFHHHHYGLAAVNLGGAVFLIGLNIFLVRARKRDAQRHAEVMAEFQTRQAEIMARIRPGMIIEARMLRTEESVMSQEAHDKSLKNLALVVQAVGAKNIHMSESWPGPYVLKVKKQFFRVDHTQVYSTTKDGELASGTCIQSGALPPAEVIATLLLLLKHDPQLFERWRNDNGTYYGA